ncbi:hypothetical protein C5D44_15400 [Rathayibacter sp. AY1B5]|nr:hypothetical protein C5D44_15400 [Rathayibacter sp. AY1B5]
MSSLNCSAICLTNSRPAASKETVFEAMDRTRAAVMCPWISSVVLAPRRSHRNTFDTSLGRIDS